MKTKLVLACALGSAWRLRPLPQATTLSRTPRPINAQLRRQSRPRKARPWSWSATAPLMQARRKLQRPWRLLTLASRPEPDRADDLNRVETRRDPPAGFSIGIATDGYSFGFSCSGSQYGHRVEAAQLTLSPGARPIGSRATTRLRPQ